MSNNPYGFNKYKQTSVTTASKGQVLIMLYEAAIKNCKLAIEAINSKNLAKKGEHIVRTNDIINELSLALDHNVGGNLSRDLERLYVFMVEQITEANINNTTKPLETVIKLLETLIDGWKVAVKEVNTKFGGDPRLAAAKEIEQGIASTAQNNVTSPKEEIAAKNEAAKKAETTFKGAQVLNLTGINTLRKK